MAAVGPPVMVNSSLLSQVFPLVACRDDCIPTYPAPTTHTFLTDCTTWPAWSALDWANCTSLRSSISDGRKSGLELGVVGPVEQDKLLSEKTSMGISSHIMVRSGKRSQSLDMEVNECRNQRNPRLCPRSKN